MLGQIDMTDLARALSISAVVDEAGLSHQTFHNTYPGSSRSGGTGGKEAFVEDLLDNLTVNYSASKPLIPIPSSQGSSPGRSRHCSTIWCRG
ncbi:hypothetical protein BJF84_12200 [Rhodococcus sp. CUA-806]|nr:hypothetical protein BJF84_12200 [Rhodococcus sp. CUA-806]